VSTAARVPETHELEGDDALETLREVGAWELVRDGFVRFRFADGFSHSRALAFQFTLAVIPALIAMVGLATLLGQQSFTDVLTQTVRDMAPGPASELLTQAFQQGSTSSAQDDAETALIVGGLAAFVSAATAMGQIERGSNRIYGVERDRPALRKYALATLLACTAGLATTAAFVLLVPGSALGGALKEVTGWSDALDTAWSIGRWPLGAALVAAAVAVLFKLCPSRAQPSFSWLAFGSTLSVLLWFAFTGLLAAYLDLSQGFGETYGPLAGVIGLLLWTFLTALALFLGLAVAAQLEAVRAGAPRPRAEITVDPIGREPGLMREGLSSSPRTGR
jgi:YihY family inner membrane protein